jgi:ABC-type multidrug transport system ATPase subunit
MIRVQNLTQHYSLRPVLRDINLQVAQGEIVVIVGPNGSGKTTLLAAMAGVLHPQRGQVEIGGLVRRSTLENELAIRKQVIYLPTDAWLPEGATGREFLLAVGRLYGVEDDRLFAHIDKLAELFNLTDKIDSVIGGYSTGQKKKIALAGALATEAPVMLLDEPFSGGLDPAGIVALKQVLKRLVHEHGFTLVFSTPVPEQVEEMADRIALLGTETITFCGTVDEIRAQAAPGENFESTLARLLNPGSGASLQHYFDTPAER